MALYDLFSRLSQLWREVLDVFCYSRASASTPEGPFSPKPCVIKPENLSFSVVGVSVIFLLSKNVEWHDLVSHEILHDM